ncbi:LPXTG-motif cell wall-anchored protein [Streptomyces africanus]|uniref:LPXTG-motif cell wall-anchored protein n=1 Tax=Streptomyces africanus TaxID=231024 RepID=A0ABU0R1W9_9ACTN|nr:chaplin [Streptomyces africanus]MDQ0753617.1 LPXTG-motif cell wall-anchored protein [Streptomyces africanus]
MNRVTRNGVIAVAAASGAMALTAPAYAGSGADGSAAGSPGVVSGNTVQLPVHVPVNVCGNTVNVVGLLNAAAGNSCANKDDRRAGRPGKPGGAAAEGGGKDAPGVVSGNGVQLPVDVPVNLTGNTVDVVGIGNPSTGNESSNTSGDHPVRPHHPSEPVAKPPTPPRPHPAPEPAPHTAAPQVHGALAHTGTDHTLQTVAAGAALVFGGVVLRRRRRPQTASATPVSSTIPESP